MKCRSAVLAAALAVLGLPCLSKAQTTDAFTLDLSLSGLTGHYQTSYRHPKVLPTDMVPDPCVAGNPYCGVGTFWPEPCPSGLNCDPHGTVQLTAQATVSGLIIPWYLGFPNNGYLPNDCTLVYGAVQFNPRPNGTMSDGSKLGDTWNFTGNATCSGYAQDVTFSVVTNWAVTLVKSGTGWGGPFTTYTYQLTGGSGTATYAPPS
jgi:hypothetical protein